MATCYLFVNELGEDNILSLRLNAAGQVDEPLQSRSISELQTLTAKTRTIVVLSSEFCSFYEVELPKLSQRKARSAIPYALEDQVAQNIDTLHFAFSQNLYHNQRYLVAVIDKALLAAWVKKIQQLSISFDALTIDWFALKPDEAVVKTDSLMVNETGFKGTLNPTLAKHYLQKCPVTVKVLAFGNSNSLLAKSSHQHGDESVYTWIAQRLYQSFVLDLCQGEFEKRGAKHSFVVGYKTFAILIAVWLMSFLLSKSVQWYTLNQEIKQTEQQIAQVYRTFFPDARQIVNPKFRINQLLKTASLGRNQTIWTLLSAVADTLPLPQFQVLAMRYQNQSLSIQLTAQDFSTLEQLQLKLRQSGVQVRQAKAALQEKQVLATLELNL